MAGARGPARWPLVGRLFGPRNRRRDPEQRAQRSPVLPHLLRGAGLVAVVAACAVAWPEVAARARRHPYFQVREIAVRHKGRLTAEAVRRAAGIVPGTSIWDLDLAAAEQALRGEMWVRTAKVERHLPDRIVIRVREHRPVAILATEGKEPALYYVARSGRVFAAVGADDPKDLPYLTGLAASELDGHDAFAPRALRHALSLLRLLDRGAAGRLPVSEIAIHRDRGLTLMPMRPAVPIELGWGAVADKLGRLARVLPQWADREAEMVSVTCVFDDLVVVRTRTEAPPAKAKRPVGARA